ncbi:U-box domain-containing protein 62-like [Cornus florida]|uniref:U-box domain-containing protein 62-like n=1 Tax=Cornus florida TaxID=4283 RepID=UPI00289B1102|nr:U-box domain-containing protein 62-like [Cornus florida]
MTSENIGLVPTQRLDNGLNSQLGFQDENLRFNCGAPQRRVGDVGPKTRELSGFIDERFFQPQAAEFRRNMFADLPQNRQEHQENRNWDGNGRASTTPSGDGSDEDEDDDDDEDDEEEEADEGDDGEIEGIVVVGGGNNSKNNNTSGHSSVGKIVASSREVMMKDDHIVQCENNTNNNTRASPSVNDQQGRVSQYQNAVKIADPDGNLFYSQYLQGPEGSASGQKGTMVENGCGFSGRKDGSYSCESGESLRVILSDPLTGELMDDAVILPCGHSFGGGGIPHVIRMKACYTCSQAVSEDLVAPNLSLQAAVQAFLREEELHVRPSKRRRERFDPEKGNYSIPMFLDHPRGKGVQFPFNVADRVIIKGNKRTPQRFVGREAVVTTQCLNGWYVVKTLDNAESVKLQYRSLAKVSDDPSPKPMSSKMTPNWL